MATSKIVNLNFRIKVNGKGISTLVGVTGLTELIGEELAAKFMEKALESTVDIATFKLRRGLTIRFYSK